VGITIEEALSLETMQQAKVIAGRNGLSREINWVTILEVLDEISALHEGELLVSTAFGLSEIPGLLTDLIPNLNKRKLAGLAIQTGYYLETIPGSIIQQCDELNFPLLELPKQMVFSTLTMAIINKIVSKQMETLEYARQIHNRMTMIILKNKGLPQIASVLSELVDAPVRIFDANHNLLAHAGIDSESSYLNPEKIYREFEKVTSTAGCSEPIIIKVHPPGSTAFPVQILQPLTVGYDIYGYISILTHPDKLKELAQIAISSAATVCTLEILKEQAVAEAEDKIKGDFIDDLLDNTMQDENVIRRRAKKIGLNLSEHYRILILSVDSLKDLTIANEELFMEHKKRLSSLVRFVLRSFQSLRILKDKSNKLIILLPVKSEAAKDDVIRVTTLLKNTINKEMRIKVTIGVGQSYQQLSHVSCSFREAGHALSIGCRLQKNDCVIFYEDLGPYSMFANVNDNSEMKNYYLKTVDALIQHDALHRSDLVATLEAFLRCNNQIKDTAKELFVHRHTLKYRLNRIHELTGLDPESVPDQFQLQLGLIAARLLSKLGPTPPEASFEEC